MFPWLKKAETAIQEEKKLFPTFSDKQAISILEEIKYIYGLDYSKQQYTTFRKIERFALQNNFLNFYTLKDSLSKNKKLYEKLINMLTVGETYFYREIDQIKIITDYIKNSRVNKVLCAPCSSGEEVYSLLIYLKENNLLNRAFSIKGIDINSDAIDRAKTATFSNRSTSQLPKEIRTKYFTNTNNSYQISSLFKSHASFEKFNIFDKNIEKLGSYDIVLSRNMLIYFDDITKKKALKQLEKLLNPKGILCLGHADISFQPEGLKKYKKGLNIFYKPF